MAAANQYLQTVYLPAYNNEFMHPATEDGSAFVACPDGAVLDDILCEQFERVVGKDNCVLFENLVLQIPPDRHRHHYMKVKVKVLRHTDGTLSIKHGPRRLARYDTLGQVLTNELPIAV